MNDKAVVKNERFGELANKIDTDNPNEEDVKELRKLFTADPQLYYEKINLSQLAIDSLIHKVKGTPLIKESMKMNVSSLRLDLGYKDTSSMEKLLIEQIILCWLRMNLMENAYTQYTISDEGMSIKAYQHWEHKLSSVQKRYLRAVETLARVKKIKKATLQVNIAADGGKQVNVA